MASISAKNVSILFPLVGSDKRFGKPKDNENIPVGGRIIRGREAGILALDDFNIELKDGDRLGIFGHNGSGKSTLLRVLGGIYPPTKGTIEIQGTTAGMFSLSVGLSKEATGIQNIEFKGLMRGMSRREVADLVPQIAEFSELGDYLHLPVKTYSSGMVMRLVFATASMMKPDILLMDEWVSAGDSTFREKADRYLDEILEATRIVIVASQGEKRLREWSNKLVYLKGGRSVPVPEASLGNYKAPDEMVKEYKILVNQRLFEKALKLISKVWPKDKVPFLYHQHRGTMFQRLERNDEALASYLKALDIEPDNPTMHNMVGKLLYRLKQPDRAFEHISTALNLSDGIVGDISTLKLVAQMADRESEIPAGFG